MIDRETKLPTMSVRGRELDSATYIGRASVITRERLQAQSTGFYRAVGDLGAIGTPPGGSSGGDNLALFSGTERGGLVDSARLIIANGSKIEIGEG